MMIGQEMSTVLPGCDAQSGPQALSSIRLDHDLLLHLTGSSRPGSRTHDTRLSPNSKPPSPRRVTPSSFARAAPAPLVAESCSPIFTGGKQGNAD
eukprot:3358996-Rhodomonas_salina.3